MRLFVPFALVLASACSDPATLQKLADIEQRLEQLEKAPPAAGRDRQANPDEDAARKLLQEASVAFRNGDTDKAKELIEKIGSEYGSTRAAGQAGRLKAELELIGSEVGNVTVGEWLQGDLNINDHKATLLVFWELWCPHCKREVPKLQETYTKFKDKGLGMAGVTQLSRNTPPEDIMSFAKDQGLSYAIGKDDGTLSQRFLVSGVPAAAAVKDGKVVWRGHPAQLTDAMIEEWLN